MTLGSEPGTYRIRATATRRTTARISDSVGVWVPGAQESRASRRRSVSRAARRQKTYAPGDTARLIVRGEQMSGSGARHQGRPARHLAPRAAGHAGDADRGADRGRRRRRHLRQHRLPARRPALSRRAAPVGAGRRSARCTITLTADQAVAKPHEPGVFTVTRHRRGRRAGARAGEPRRDRRSGLRVEAGRRRPIRCASSIAANTAASARRSRATTTSSATPAPSGCSSPAAGAGRSRWPTSRATSEVPAAGAQGLSRRDLLDRRSRHRRARHARKVSLKYPDALTTWRLTARAVTTRHASRHGHRADDDDQGSDRAGDHAAVPDRRRRGRAADDRPQLPAGARRTRRSRSTAKGLQPRRAAPTRRRSTASIAADGERRDDWRFRAPTPGTATVTGSRARPMPTATRWSCRFRCCRTACSASAGTQRLAAGAGEATADRHHSGGVEPRRPQRSRVAGAVAGRLDARRARLPHRLSRTAAPSRRSRASCPTSW